MHPHLFHTILITITITLMFHTTITLVIAQYNEQYLKCNNTRFNCGDNFEELGYPFWGQDQLPAYCGHPQFELNCSGDAPQIMIGSISYRVLGIVLKDRNLTVVRSDYWRNPCSKDGRSDVFNPDFFRYGSDTQNLSLYYGCPSSAVSAALPGLFSCPDDGVGLTNFYVTGSMRSATSNLQLPSCGTVLNIRISDSAAGNLDSLNLSLNQVTDRLTVAINSGFWIEWNASNSLCDECTRSGGLCGSDNTTTRAFACYCKDRAYAASCGSDAVLGTGSGMFSFFFNSFGTRSLS
ncbi:Wall-associated receptor kinase [Parasponia andersonii]|uniref:non-specific serine/threonine protein kinase n=1 Tax=Parasponia andersonii TaxID=3476 RepID=A0A2P5BWE7_PARAD|nr:Wall-associated receptor kinase [Parasponia andersonii]